jgi:AcrR family transcriptional regulator
LLVLLQLRTRNDHYTIVNHSCATETHFTMDPTSDTLRLDRRRAAVICAARHLFVEQGYERTTLAEIVTRAGGSLSTVYKLFGNKDGLLEAVIRENAVSGETLVRDAEASQLSPVETLRRIAEGLHEHFLDPEVIALVRIVIARSISEPQFARQFFERTANRTRDEIAALFARWQAHSVAMNGTPEFLAEMFMGLFVSDLQTQAISHGAAINQMPERLHDRTDFFIAAAGLSADSNRRFGRVTPTRSVR